MEKFVSTQQISNRNLNSVCVHILELLKNQNEILLSIHNIISSIVNKSIKCQFNDIPFLTKSFQENIENFQKNEEDFFRIYKDLLKILKVSHFIRLSELCQKYTFPLKEKISFEVNLLQKNINVFLPIVEEKKEILKSISDNVSKCIDFLKTLVENEKLYSRNGNIKRKSQLEGLNFNKKI